MPERSGVSEERRQYFSSARPAPHSGVLPKRRYVEEVVSESLAGQDDLYSRAFVD